MADALVPLVIVPASIRSRAPSPGRAVPVGTRRRTSTRGTLARRTAITDRPLASVRRATVGVRARLGGSTDGRSGRTAVVIRRPSRRGPRHQLEYGAGRRPHPLVGRAALPLALALD